jgi:hypothetical protein
MDDQILDDKTRLELPGDFGGRPVRKKWYQNTPVIFSSILAVILLAVIAWYFLFSTPKTTKPTSKSVSIVIKAPSEIVSGNEAEFKIDYHNAESADLVSVYLELFYPSGFKFKSSSPQANSSTGTDFNLPILKSGQNSEVIVRGKLEGTTGEEKQIKAVIHYKLSNFNSEFAVDQTAHTTILPPNLTLDVNGPIDVVNGQDTTFTLNYTNVTGQDIDNLALQLTYPDGFSFTSSNPPATKNGNYWKLPKLTSNNSGSIEVTGSFTGESSEAKLVKAEMGQIINNNFASQLVSTATFHIIPSSLEVTLTSDAKDGVVNLGDSINYHLKYVNQGSIGLNNILIVVNFDSTALDLPRLSAPDAIITGHTLTWKSATRPSLNALSPSEHGQIDFTIPVTQNLSTNLKNQVVRAVTTISADELGKPTKAADVTLKLASQLSLTVLGDYISGAAPMEVGKTTLFGMSFLLSNLSNDVSNTKVTASLPLPASAWKNVIVPDAEKNRLSYDPNSGKIIWDIGDLSAFSGKFIPVAKVSFQLEVTPTETDRNKVLNLLSNVQAFGNDSFTGKDIQTQKINTVSTSDIDDDVINAKGPIVK